MTEENPKITQLNLLREENLDKIKQFGNYQVPIQLEGQAALVRINILLDSLLEDEEKKLDFELLFEAKMGQLMDQILTAVRQAALMQGVR